MSLSINDMHHEAVCIVQRYKDRGREFPKHYISCDNDLAKEQEVQDFELLNQWRHDDHRFPGPVINYLDAEMPGWRGKQYYFFLPKAQHIVNYYNRKGSFIAPVIKMDWPSSKDEFEDYRSVCMSKRCISHETQDDIGCPNTILAYLNREAPNWLSIGQCKVHERMDECFVKAEGIVERYQARGGVLPKEWRDHKHDPQRGQEYRDAQKLSKWKETLKRQAQGHGQGQGQGRQGRSKSKGGHLCPPQLAEYLDINMPDWRLEVRDKNVPPMLRAREIVERYRQRGCVIPRQLSDRANQPEKQQEFKDAVRLKDWKRALKRQGGRGGGKCDDDIRIYLDTNMPGWRTRVYTKRGTSESESGNTITAGEKPDTGEGSCQVLSSSIAGTSDETTGGATLENAACNVIAPDNGLVGSDDDTVISVSLLKESSISASCLQNIGGIIRSYSHDSSSGSCSKRLHSSSNATNVEAKRARGMDCFVSSSSPVTVPLHDDEEINAAAGLVAVAAHSPRM